MTEPLPRFRFHTDPPALTSVKPSDLVCACCGQARGYRVAGHYGLISYDCICPWCVADGSAHARLGATFVQNIWGDVSPELAAELHQRNPGYESWQGESWPTHCDEPCVFHGDLPRQEILALPADAEAGFLAENEWIDFWEELKVSYSEGHAPEALYKFVCGQCGFWRIGIDFT
jgi:uncharacterized protein